MSVAPVEVIAEATLSDLVDGLAARTAGWCLVERDGIVITHGTGATTCPSALAETLLAKDTRALRAAVRWTRTSRGLIGDLDGSITTTVSLGEGVSAWLIGAEAEALQALAPALADALIDHPLPEDAQIEELLHPRGPSRRLNAPSATIVVVRSSRSVRAVARSLAAVIAGAAVRAHADHDVLVLVPTEVDLDSLLRQIARLSPDAVVGIARVARDAADWSAAGRLARASAAAAERMGLPVGDCGNPSVAAEVVLRHAQEAVVELIPDLVGAPMEHLRCHDERSSGELCSTLREWCKQGFDTAATSASLHVHVNTLRYRLRRVEQISGLDLADPRQRLALQLLLTV